MQNLQMYLVSLHFLCAAHTSHGLAGYFHFPSPPPTIFSSLCILKSPKSLPSGSCLGLLGSVCFSGNWRSSELDSLQFWTSDIQDLPTSCRKFLYFTFLFVFSVLYTKNAFKTAQFSRCSTTFFNHFTVFLRTEWKLSYWSAMFNPSWIYYTRQQHKASLLPFCFPVFPPFVYNCCIMDHTHHSHKTCPSTLAPLCHHSSRTLTSPSRWHGMPLLAFIVPQTLTFLSSNVWDNLTLLWKLSL